MDLKFTSALGQKQGTIANLLKQSYAELISSEPDLWGKEKENWEQFDRDVFEYLDTIGAIIRFMMEQRNVKSTEGILPNFFVLITAALLLYGLLLISYITAEWIVDKSHFIISPLHCGSDATDWHSTNEFVSGHMTLATAMAISGAAINPHTGVAGKGPTRNRLVSFLMTMLNLRLGYWVANPGRDLFGIVPPNYFQPGLKGLLGTGFDEDSYYIELSDGGHFDNTGLYELIRRKAKVIVLSDGSADPDCAFDDFTNAVERVRVDFGVNIKFLDDDTNVQQMMLGSAGNSIFQQKYQLAKKGFAIGAVEYPGNMTGTIYYLKTILTDDLPSDIYGYKSANPSFPDQSTSDQFFDETQFEAYRELTSFRSISFLTHFTI